ncbi:hypothetical protein [Crassaminicella thermophila]|uniref:hypothetical protein n=1 Tax=Crassaminicella thermophila TaxID=2599308 RepID=UPI00143DFAB3|nr:hypothetical protein [Crassaminicella thermophila]
MGKRRLIRKILGILLALGGTIILIEYIPLWIWYCVLGGLCIIFLLLLFKII